MLNKFMIVNYYDWVLDLDIGQQEQRQKKIKIREEEAIGKLTKKKKIRNAKREREKNEWNEECKSEKGRLF